MQWVLIAGHIINENDFTLINKLTNNCKIDLNKNNINKIIKTKLFSWKQEEKPKSNFCFNYWIIKKKIKIL